MADYSSFFTKKRKRKTFTVEEEAALARAKEAEQKKKAEGKKTDHVDDREYGNDRDDAPWDRV